MAIDIVDLRRWNRFTVALGGAAWTLALVARSLGWIALSDPELLLALALCVITPLALPLTLTSLPNERRQLHTLSRAVLLLHPIAALLGVVSLLLRPGPYAAALASVWLLYTALIALLGAARLVRKGKMSLADVCLALALVYLPIGGMWLTLARAGLRPLGFSPIIVLLTAVHFHFITLAALTITGLTGRAHRAAWSRSARVLYRVASAGMLVSPLLVATGITLTQLTGAHLVESIAAILLACSLTLIALLGLWRVAPRATPILAQSLLVISYASVLVAMLLAGAYALGAVTGAWAISISQMIATHGWINACAFGLCGLLGWRLNSGQRHSADVGEL